MEWAVGELIVKGNEQEVHSLDELEKNIKYKFKNGKVLLETRKGMIVYFLARLRLRPTRHDVVKFMHI